MKLRGALLKLHGDLLLHYIVGDSWLVDLMGTLGAAEDGRTLGQGSTIG